MRKAACSPARRLGVGERTRNEKRMEEWSSKSAFKEANEREEEEIRCEKIRASGLCMY